MNKWPVVISMPQGLGVGGVTTWALQLASALAERGREVRIVAHDFGGERCAGDPSRAFDGDNPRVVRAANLDDPDGWRDSLRTYRDLTPALLLPNLSAESYALAAALAMVHPERVRVVAWNHSDNPYDYAYLAHYEPIIHRYAAVSRRCHAELRRRLSHRTEDIEHLPHGVAIPDLTPRPPRGERRLHLLYAGRIEQAGKRVLEFVKLALRLCRRGVRFEVRLIGDGPQSAELESRMAAAEDEIVAAGSVIRHEPGVPHDQMSAIWAWADIGLLNSLREGFSVSTLEAMSSGCVPVVSRVASGVAEIIEDGHNGLTFSVGDVEAMAECVARLAADDAALQRMSHAAYETARSRFSFEAYFERARSILDRAAVDADRPWPAARRLLMDSPDAPGSATVPHDAAARLRSLLMRIARSQADPIAIYGAGKHTRALASVWADSPARIVAVIDDDYGLTGRRLWGWPVVTPEMACDTGAKSVVISSWLHEAEICRSRARALEAAGLRVFRLYTEEPQAAAVAVC